MLTRMTGAAGFGRSQAHAAAAVDTNAAAARSATRREGRVTGAGRVAAVTTVAA